MKKKFLRLPRLKKLGNKWRRPRGYQNKLRLRKKSKGRIPSPGYGKKNKGMHPSGFREILVQNPKDLKKLDPKKHAARVSSSVGKRKRQKLLEENKKRKVKILNPGKNERQ